jgi:AcrR family transcriptional regulator
MMAYVNSHQEDCMPTPDRTSLAEIVEAARELLELGGPAKITMQAVAERVGVRAPSLYKRVRDRDALVVLVAESTAGDLGARLAASDGTLSALARTFRTFAHAHPEGFRLMFAVHGARELMGQASAPVLDAARAIVGEDRALDAARLLTAWAMGFISMELADAFQLGGDVDESFEFGLGWLEAGLRG